MAVAHSLTAECCVFLNDKGEMVSFHRYDLGLVLLMLGDEHVQQNVAFFLLVQYGALDHLCDSFCYLEMPGSSEFTIGSHWATGQWGL